MSTLFKKGDLLLYFNRDNVHIVLLDEIAENYFTIVTSDDGHYQYGYKIRIKNLTDKYFLKLDQNFPITGGSWEIYDYSDEIPPPVLFTLSQIPNDLAGLQSSGANA